MTILDENAVTYAVASCRVPFSLQAKVNKKVQLLEDQGVLITVDEPSKWVGRMVATQKKSGDIRICIKS